MAESERYVPVSGAQALIEKWEAKHKEHHPKGNSCMACDDLLTCIADLKALVAPPPESKPLGTCRYYAIPHTRNQCIAPSDWHPLAEKEGIPKFDPNIVPSSFQVEDEATRPRSDFEKGFPYAPYSPPAATPASDAAMRLAEWIAKVDYTTMGVYDARMDAAEVLAQLDALRKEKR